MELVHSTLIGFSLSESSDFVFRFRTILVQTSLIWWLYSVSLFVLVCELLCPHFFSIDKRVITVRHEWMGTSKFFLPLQFLYPPTVFGKKLDRRKFIGMFTWPSNLPYSFLQSLYPYTYFLTTSIPISPKDETLIILRNFLKFWPFLLLLKRGRRKGKFNELR